MGGFAQRAQPLAGSLPSSVLAVVTSDYDMPNQQSPTQLFYHDHVMGVTRIGLIFGSRRDGLLHPRSEQSARRFELAATQGAVRDPACSHVETLLHGRKLGLPTGQGLPQCGG